jgi:long-chain acyl-CoA synthetase
MMAGGVSVPLFAKISHENFIYECAQANIRFLFVQGADQWAMYEEHRNLFEKVIGLDEFTNNVVGAIKYHEILQIGEMMWEKKGTLWEELANRVNTNDICTIIYTAGSTGMPKGVQLTHQNLCHLISFEVFGWGKDGNDKYLSILPLAHVFARQINLILIAWGVSIYYLNDLSKMSSVSKDIQPTLMIVVPRVLERMYSSIESRIRSGEKNFKNWMGNWAFDLAADMSDNFFKKHVLRPIADYFVYSHLRNALGGKWRVILCGGAALDKTLNQFYLNIGIPVYEGWGLSETSTVCVNTPFNQKVGTVGKPLPGVKIKLGENDELLVGGPTVMKGYYRNPEATQTVIDEEGWLHTGDKGAVDNEGYVRITGRVKEQFKLSSGEYLSPSRIEHILTQHPLIDMAMVIGEKRKYAAALLFPDLAAVRRFKKEQKMENLTDEKFLKTPFVENEMEGLLKKANQKTNSWERLLKYRLIMTIPTIENGELTPTLKLKRDVIFQKYQDIIESIYTEETG